MNLKIAVLPGDGIGPEISAQGVEVMSAVCEKFGHTPEYAYAVSDPRMKKLRPCTRKEAYQADITYGTNNEFGFDYLRDNMVNDTELMRQQD